MCGLAGIFSYGDSAPPVDREELLRIRERMHSRGPDGAGIWVSGDSRVGLAHRRLAIIDLTEAGAQPMSDPETGNRIVFNGEIYNYRELRAELEATGHHFRTHSDTEVLLKLYAAHGRDMLHKLRGMYAFALWHEKKRGIFLARDPFGIKPLYLADDGKTLRIASQVKALLAGGQINTTPEPAGHVGFFLWGSVPDPYTLYKGIRALPAGTSLWLDTAGRKETKQFFSITNELAQACETRQRLTSAEVHERLRTALLDSVRHHLIADVPVGVFLSAGLDSTTIAALVKEAGIEDLRTVTLGFKEFVGTPNDETPLAQLVAQRYGARHHTRWVQREDFSNNIDTLFAAMDQPTIDGVNTFFVCKATKEAGLKVALSGLGGDELFGGYSDFQQIPRMVSAFRPYQAMPWLGRGFRYLSMPILKHFTSPKYAGLLEYGGTYGGAYLLRRGLYMPWELPDVLDGDLVRQGWQELQTLNHLKQSTAGMHQPHLQVTALETAWYMQNQLLRDSDWASTAHSLELRVPLVDIELFKIVTSLIGAGYPLTKRDMASAPSVPLPDAVLNREKTGFAIPVREWLLDSGERRSSKLARGLRSWAGQVLKKAHKQWERGGLRVVLIYRKPRIGAYSIEELFHTIAGELGKQVEVIEYEVEDRGRVLVDAWRLRQLDADVYHVTGDINYLVSLLPSKKTLLTVHDIGHYLFGLRGIKRCLYKWFWLILPIRSATAITTVSMETRENIVKHLGITDKRIEVIENCHSATFKPVAKPITAECPIVLQVGTKPYKNVPRLVEALKDLRCRLVLIGSLDDETKQKLAECGVEYENHVALTHEEIYKRYIECDVVSFVSLGEGFGVPIIEAQAVGRPVITANLSPMCDVAGEGACLVDPLDISQIREGIHRIICDETYRDQIVDRGFRNVSRYSPATISDQYLALYKKLALA